MIFGLFIIHVHLLDLVLYKPLNISGVPFNTTKPKLDGRVEDGKPGITGNTTKPKPDGLIEGGKPANIVHYPHQVKFLN